METIPIWVTILGICGGITTIISAIEKIVNASRAVNAPNAEQNRRLKELEIRCDRYDTFFSSDKQRITDLEQSLSILMQGTLALISHAVNGNDVDKLKDTQEHMLEYLTKRGIKV